MALRLVDDDLVLEAALSLLEQPDGDSTQRTSTDSPQRQNNKKKRKSSSNRAREAQYQELLALREQVPRLEKHLAELQEQAQHKSSPMLDLWRKLATVERQSRANAEDENRRLRALVRENADATAQSVHQLLQTNTCRQEHSGSEADAWPPERWPYRHVYAVPVDPSDGNLIQEMATSVDAVYRQVLQVYSPESVQGTSECPATRFQSVGNAHRRRFADKELPFDVDSVADAAWQFFAHSSRRPTTRFYYHPDAHQAAGLVSDDTVVEIFGEEHRFGHVLLDIKIKQIVRRYVAADRVVVAWRALLSPDKFKTETLSDVVYEEKGALVIEPCPSLGGGAAASVVHTWQMITPDIAAASLLQSEVVQELTQFVLNSCRPGRAIQSMERTLRAH